MVDGLIFDLDGTLMETRGGIVAAFNIALGESGFAERRSDEIYSLIGTPLEDMFDELAPTGDTKKLCSDYRAAYSKMSIALSRPYPHVKKTLAELLKTHRLAVATTKKASLAKQLCDAHGLTEFFGAIVGGDLVTHTKPAPDMVLLAAEKIGVDPKSSMMVGDTRFDILAGRAAGMRTCGVTYGFGTRQELEDAGSDHIISKITQLPLLAID